MRRSGERLSRAEGRPQAPVGDSSTVEQRTLTPLILVRIQVPQPAALPNSGTVHRRLADGCASPCGRAHPAPSPEGLAERRVAGEGEGLRDLAHGKVGEREELARRVEADLVADRLEDGALGGELPAKGSRYRGRETAPCRPWTDRHAGVAGAPDGARGPRCGPRALPSFRGDLGEDLLATDGIGIGTGKVDVVAGDDEAVLALVEADGRAQDALVDRGVVRPGVADMDLQRLDPPAGQVAQDVAADGEDRVVELAAAGRGPVVDAVAEREIPADTVQVDRRAAGVAELPADEILKGLAKRRGLPAPGGG